MKTRSWPSKYLKRLIPTLQGFVVSLIQRDTLRLVITFVTNENYNDMRVKLRWPVFRSFRPLVSYDFNFHPLYSCNVNAFYLSRAWMHSITNDTRNVFDILLFLAFICLSLNRDCNFNQSRHSAAHIVRYKFPTNSPSVERNIEIPFSLCINENAGYFAILSITGHRKTRRTRSYIQFSCPRNRIFILL